MEIKIKLAEIIKINDSYKGTFFFKNIKIELRVGHWSRCWDSSNIIVLILEWVPALWTELTEKRVELSIKLVTRRDGRIKWSIHQTVCVKWQVVKTWALGFVSLSGGNIHTVRALYQQVFSRVWSRIFFSRIFDLCIEVV